MFGVNAFRLCVYICIPPQFSQKNLMSHNCTCCYDINHSSEWPHMIQKKMGCIQFEYWWRGVTRSLMFYKVGLFISRTLPLVTLMFVLKADFLVLFSSVRHYCHTFYGSIWLHIWSYDVISCTERKDSNQRYAKYRLTFRPKSCSLYPKTSNKSASSSYLTSGCLLSKKQHF